MAVKREIKTSFKTYPVTNFNKITVHLRDKKKDERLVRSDIYSERGILLAADGTFLSEERARKMQRELEDALSKGKPSPYYTTERTDYSSN